MICGHPEVDAGKCHAGDRSYTAVNSHMAGGVLELVKQLYK